MRVTLKKEWKLFCILTLIYGISVNVSADAIQDPCGGTSALLNILDRPTLSDSACAVPFKKAVLEAGYEYQHLMHSAGHEQNFPQAEFRLGLPANNEFVVVLPNYFHQSMMPHSGSGATTLGIKHEIGYNQTWLGAAEALFTLPDGSAAFGSKEVGAAVNGIVTYTFNPVFSLTLMLGVTTQTEPAQTGGQRFTSVNPDLVFTYTASDKLQLYGEFYGQSKTGPGEDSGFNSDAGLLYLVLTNLEVDFEVGQRVSGNLGSFDHYVGTGFGIMF